MEAGERSPLRVVVHPNRGNLALIAVICGSAGIASLGLGALAAMVGGVAAWIVMPAFVGLAALLGTLCWWAIRSRALKDPAFIVDESGIYDNISAAHAGRMKWRDMNRVWTMGPSWMRLLCLRPENVVPYVEGQNESRGTVMRVNRALFDAPVVIPLASLDMPSDDVWQAIVASGGTGGHSFPSGLATH